MPSDLVVLGGAIITLDPQRPRVAALASRDGVLVALGSEAEARRAVAPTAKTLDFRRALVLPGLRDSHAHLLQTGRSLLDLDLREARSAEQAADRVRSAAGAVSPECWIEGRGWDQNLFSPPEFPDARWIDEAGQGRPVYLKRIDGHAAWVNHAAMMRAGIEDTTPDPPGGKLLRRPDGRLLGVVLDRAMEIIEAAIPTQGPEHREMLLARAAERFAEHGLVEVHDMGIDQATWDALAALERRGDLPLRVVAYLEDRGEWLDRHDGPLGRPPPLPGSRLEVRGVKMYLDGALGSRGAALEDDYADNPGNRGLLLTPPAVIEARARMAVISGWQPAVHAIGDRAVHLALDAFERAAIAGTTPPQGIRFRLEHAQVVRPADIGRMARLGVVAAMQPVHFSTDRAWATARLGAKRLATAYAWRSLARAGVRLAFGSDAPVESPDPRAGIAAARNGEQSLTFAEILAAYTAAPAWAAFAERRRGQLRRGQACDLSVFGGDTDALIAGDAAEWKRATVTASIVGGAVHRASSSIAQHGNL